MSLGPHVDPQGVGDRFGAPVREGPTVADLVSVVASGQRSPVELVEDALSAIGSDPLHAFLTIAGDQARADARRAEELQRRGGLLPPLLGVPVAVKDLHETAGVRTTYGSVRFADHVPDEDCAVVARLREAGAIVVGKTNTPAFGLISETKNRLGPPCANPFDPSRTSGGSSGGSAVAVACGMVPAATGSDAAGSINVPSAFCGVYGFKPSVGLVPSVPPASSLQPFCADGPIARTVEDAGLLLDVLAGYDPRDPISRPTAPVGFAEAAREGLERPLRVAFSEDLGLFDVDDDLRRGVRDVAARLEAESCQIEEAAPVLEDPMGLYLDLYISDARRSFLAEPATLDELFPESVAELRDAPRRTAEEYVDLLERLWSLRASMTAFFTRYDLLVVPTTATPAFPHDRPPAMIGGRPVEPGWTTFMPFTPIVNLTGQPAASVPAGHDTGGLPLGVLLVGAVGADEVVLRASLSLVGR